MLTTMGFLKKTIGRARRLFYTRARKRHALVGAGYLWELKREFQIKFLKDTGLSPGDYLMDIGCGTLRGGIPTIAFLDEGHYYGIEIRDFVLKEGEKELRDNALEHKQPKLIHTDTLGKVELGALFNVIWCFSVLIHMENDVLEECLDMASRHLRPDGAFYGNVNIGSKGEGSWQGFPVMRRSLLFYQEMASRFGLEVSELGSLRSLGHFSGVKEQDEQRMLRFFRS